MNRLRMVLLVLIALIAAAPTSVSALSIVELTSGERITGSFTWADGKLTVADRAPLVATEVRKILFGIADSSGSGEGSGSEAAVATEAQAVLDLASQAAAFRSRYPDAGGITLRDDSHWTYRPDGTWVTRYHITELIMKEDHLRRAGQTFGFKEGRERIKIVRARCIHKDGTVYDADLAKLKITKPQTSPGMFINYMTASLRIPRVEVGSIIDVIIEHETYNPFNREFFFPVNYFQSPDPVFNSRLIVDLPTDKKLFWEARNFAKGAEAPKESTEYGIHRHTWEKQEVAPHIEEPCQPRGADALPYVQCALFEGWDKIYDWINVYWKANTTPTPELTELVNKIVAGLKTDDEKIAKIYHWIQKNIRYVIIKDDYATIYGSYPAMETIKKQIGCCVDKALVMSAMLNVVGIKNGPLLINVSSHDMSPRIPNLSITHSISRVTGKDGKKFYLDSTGYDFRYPSLATCNQGRYVLDPFDRSFDMAPLQPPEMNKHRLISSLSLALDGTITVRSEKQYAGEVEAGSRASMKNLKPAEREKMLSNRINDYGQGGRLTGLEIENLEDVELPYSYAFSYVIPNYTRDIADLAVFKIPGLLDTLDFPEAGLASRTYPIYYDALEMDQQDGTLTLAPEFKIRSLPDPLKINTKYFSFEGRIERAGDHAIKYLTCFKRLAKQIPLSDYAKFKQDVDKIKRFARERIFLTRPLADALTKGDAR